MTRTPERCAQEQLDAYNGRDIDAFCAVYADDVELIDLHSGDVFCRGVDAMRERYGRMFAERTALHCTLVHRMVCGNTAIDEEHVTGLRDDGIVHAVAIYDVRDGFISRAWFVRERP